MIGVIGLDLCLMYCFVKCSMQPNGGQDVIIAISFLHFQVSF